MATTVKQAKISVLLEVIENLSATNLSGSTSSVKELVSKLHKELNLGSGSTPDAELVYFGTQAMTAGALTIDLTALTNSEGATIASTGKKVRAIFMVPTSTNTAAITLTEGAANGYELGGNTWKLALTDEQFAFIYLGADAPDISASVKNIDVTGTGTESIRLGIIFG